MNIKNIIQIESIIGDFVSHLHITSGTPFEIIEQMLVQFVQAIGQAKAASQPIPQVPAPADPVVEAPTPEPEAV